MWGKFCRKFMLFWGGKFLGLKCGSVKIDNMRYAGARVLFKDKKTMLTWFQGIVWRMPSSAPSTSKLKKSTVGKSKAARSVRRGRQVTSTIVFTFELLNFPTILALLPSSSTTPLRFGLSIASNFTFIGDFWVERQTLAECALKQHLVVAVLPNFPTFYVSLSVAYK